MAQCHFACLPDEVLLLVAGFLDQQSLARSTATAHRFYRLFGLVLYQRDRRAAAGSTAFFWGCRTANLRTLRHAVDAGVSPGCPSAFAAALGGDDPLAVVSFLLDNGAAAAAAAATAADTGEGGGGGSITQTFWPLLARVLEAAGRAPRWCPVPVVACFLAHGACLRPLSDADADEALRVWQAVLALPQVRGPRRRWVPPPRGLSSGGRFVLRHDHCRHADAAPCTLALARLLLQHGADPRVHGGAGTTSLAVLAMCHPRRPVELLQCLAEAAPVASRPLLDMALTEALRFASLRRLPRGRNWDCYPAGVQVHQPDAVVRFLLQRGALAAGGGGSDAEAAQMRMRTRMLLDHWDPHWRRFAAAAAARRRSTGRQKRKTQRRQGR